MSHEGKQQTSIHGKTVYYAPEDRDAVRYLKEDIPAEESKIFFEEAKRRKETGATFETDHEHDYTLFYRDYAFEIEPTEEKHNSWF